jgi:hypothetical protein
MPKVRAEQLEKELTTGQPATTATATATAATDLQEELEALRVQQAVLGRELENSKTELGTLRDENDRLKLQMQALGLSALSGDQRSLQLRLLDAVNDYRLADQARQLLTEQLVKLSDAVTAYQNTSDASSRRLLDEALDQSAAVLKGTAPAEVAEPTPLEQARVVSFKRDLGLAVINCGKASGLRLGMPLSIIRKDKTIAQGVIVDCRDLITGVLITSSVAAKDGVTLGDTIKLETTQKTK